METVAIDRILFAIIYRGNGWARAFLHGTALSEEDHNRIAHGNSDRLCALRT